MAGTQTTTILSGVEPHQYEEGKVGSSGTAISPGDLVRQKAGSVGTLQPVGVGGTPAGVNVAVESGSVDIDGSYKTGEKVKYVKAQPGDALYANVEGTTTAVAAGDLLTGPPAVGTAGHLGKAGNGTLAVAEGEVSATNTGKIKVTVV